MYDVLTGISTCIQYKKRKTIEQKSFSNKIMPLESSQKNSTCVLMLFTIISVFSAAFELHVELFWKWIYELSPVWEQHVALLGSITYSFNIVQLPTKPSLFASRQNPLILHLCVFIPVLNVPFRTLTLKDPSLHAATDPAVWLRLSPLLYPWTGLRLGQKARVKQRDYQCHSHRGSQTVTQIKAVPSWAAVILGRCPLISWHWDGDTNSAVDCKRDHRIVHLA